MRYTTLDTASCKLKTTAIHEHDDGLNFDGMIELAPLCYTEWAKVCPKYTAPYDRTPRRLDTSNKISGEERQRESEKTGIIEDITPRLLSALWDVLL